MRVVLSLMILVMGASLSACNTVQVTSDWNSSFDFANLKTWQFAPPPAQKHENIALYNDGLYDGRVGQ